MAASERLLARFGLVTAWPRADWHSARLAAALTRRGQVTLLDPSQLSATIGADGVEVRRGAEALGDLDAVVLARGLGRKGDPDVQFELYRALEGTGTLVVNRLDALLAAQDKLRTSWLLRRAGVATPAAAVAQTPADAARLLDALGPAVMKPVAGSLGDGVERVEPDAPGRRAVRARVKRDGAVYLQAWVEHPGRDARLFVVGGRVAGAVERVAAPGEWRTNVGRGASARPLALGRDAARVAVKAAAALGLDWAGVDAVSTGAGATVLEVNGNPSWAGILEATGEDMAEPIAEHVWARALRRAGALEITRERADHGR